ncbi:MAG: hypothetical protein MJZ00_05850 [Paludibacteraceae bacterium]|nr:hypothetical protein [Paludibacteraceae bacterium]
MKKIFFALVLFVSVVVSAGNSFYVVMKDGSVEYYPVEKLDSATFINPDVVRMRGFNDMAAEIFNLRRELDSLKATFLDFTTNQSMGIVKKKDLSMLGITSDTLVDLGLSVKWANFNVGANECYESGDYYSWGSTRQVDSYVEDSCEVLTLDTFPLRATGVCDDRYNLASAYDVASVKWGDGYRMPTSSEFLELSDKTVSRWLTVVVDDSTLVGGVYFKSLVNGKSIFMPASGDRRGDDLFDKGRFAMYWSASASPSVYYSYCLYFDNSRLQVGNDKRFYGMTVRPVKAK